MLSWLRRRRERAEGIAAKANAPIRAFGVDDYSEARQRARQAGSVATAQEWRHVALAIARKAGGRIGLDTSTRMAINADLSAGSRGRRRLCLRASRFGGTKTPNIAVMLGARLLADEWDAAQERLSGGRTGWFLDPT
jgi:hypothetical protein